MTDKNTMTITTDDAGRPIIDGVPRVSAADFELLIADVLAEDDDETDAPIADEGKDGAMYRQAFARAEERVAGRREIERLRAVIDRAGALAAQNASAEMIRAALAEVGEADTESDGPAYGIALDRIIDFAVGKLNEGRITEAREDLRRLRELSVPMP
ncbi:MAG: hypothetical protein ABJF67_08005 [Aurantimonas coralicida]